MRKISGINNDKWQDLNSATYQPHWDGLACCLVSNIQEVKAIHFFSAGWHQCFMELLVRDCHNFHAVIMFGKQKETVGIWQVQRLGHSLWLKSTDVVIRNCNWIMRQGIHWSVMYFFSEHTLPMMLGCRLSPTHSYVLPSK
jgi:hypothetical protein